MSDQAQETREALGARLRGFRKDAGYSSGRAFAAATGWQESKVSRIENGKQNASEEDIRVWCHSTGHEADFPDLIATVRHIDEMWMEWRRQLQDGAANRQRKSLPLYQKTKVFRIWEPNVIWGTIQTADYAKAIFEEASNFHESPADTEAAVAKRLAFWPCWRFHGSVWASCHGPHASPSGSGTASRCSTTSPSWWRHSPQSCP